jgi:eukaryotic-like serine/threonine-protein kinase
MTTRVFAADASKQRPALLANGAHFASYEITGLIGSGGMGEVYRARDLKLGREVAIKILPEIVTTNHERRARFDLEAHVLAALNHPHIGAIYGVEDVGAHRGLILELVEGPTLADRLGRGPIPIREALTIAAQIADALAAAHERGIVHRDLKPANVKLTPDGNVKVLDFGLAKLETSEASAVDPSQSPTIAVHRTQDGVVLGTAAYMSPEQARGQAVDARTDIWAFGCVLYEMLTGRRAFGGESVPDIMAAIIDREPIPDVLPKTTPEDVRRLLDRCLRKNPAQRLRDAADIKLEIEDALRQPRIEIPQRPISRIRRWLVLSAIIVLSVAVAGLVTWRLRTLGAETHGPITRMTLSLSADNSLIAGLVFPEEGSGAGVAISPDGQTLAFVARSPEGSRVYLRRLDEWEPRAIPGSDGMQNPFFSPDGEWLAFSGDGRLKKVSVRGGSPVLICQPGAATGGSWGPDGFIVFGSWPKVGLWRVSADGGTPELLIRPKEGKGIRYSWPERLPNHKTILFTVWGGGQTAIAAYTPGASEPRTIVESASNARYLPTGHLVYVSDGRLIARSFDVGALALSGPSAVVVDDLNQNLLISSYAVSPAGTLAYFPGWSSLQGLAWRDRRGIGTPLPLKPRRYGTPSLSPDGKRLAVSVQTGATRNIWVGSVEREPLTRLTFGNDDYFGLWTPGGGRVVYTSLQNGHYDIFWTPSDGGGSAEPVPVREGASAKKATSWSPNGDVLLFNDDPQTGMDIWQWWPDRKQARPFINTRFRELEAVFSPNGRWVAYQSDESGQTEVYVLAYPGPGPKTRVSTDGGAGPLWNRNGRELFYQSVNGIMAVPVLDTQTMRLGAPVRLFSYQARGGTSGGRAYDVSPDGDRFLTVEPADPAHPPSQLNLVQNWFAEVRRPAPVQN